MTSRALSGRSRSAARRTLRHGWIRSLSILSRHDCWRTGKKPGGLRTPQQVVPGPRRETLHFSGPRTTERGPHAGHRPELDLGQFQGKSKPTVGGVRAGLNLKSAQQTLRCPSRTQLKVCSGRPCTPVTTERGPHTGHRPELDLGQFQGKPKPTVGGV
ncbi:hypothetical protein TIFTF001_023217 [Ficus carica]|uniref:Uncharacterized protein n=1 Tax=Ficus carica TaxID=3494 RepID=A0AA88AZX9_FICCA|nr:hypothetical protein TIFTF001_023217 [Ficus carica]